jgi:hypothetical protein
MPATRQIGTGVLYGSTSIRNPRRASAEAPEYDSMLARQIVQINRMKFQNLTSMLEERYGPNAREVEPNHWVFEVMTGDQRSQVVHLIYKELSADGQDVSRIVVNSPIGPLPPRFDLESLLRRNANLDVGAICIEDFRNDQNELVSYLTLRGTHLVSTLDFEEIWEMVEKSARVADLLEKEIYVRDLH